MKHASDGAVDIQKRLRKRWFPGLRIEALYQHIALPHEKPSMKRSSLVSLNFLQP
jgi:hypothetical protein